MEVEFMQILVSILLVVIGLSTGVAASIVFNNAKKIMQVKRQKS